MADKAFSSPESPFESGHRPDSSPDKSQKVDTKEIKERSKEFIEGVSEVVEGVETAEVSDNEVSESAGEDKKRGPQGGLAGKGGTTQSGGKSKDLPTIEIMQIQVATQIKSEVRSLEKQVSRLMSDSNFSPHKLNNLVSRVRSLRHILAELAYASAEMLKDWWLKFVKGVNS